MLTILNNPSYQKRALPLSVAAWHQMIDNNLAPDRAELIRGVIMEKMTKSIFHIKFAARLLTLLQSACDGHFWVRKEDPLTFQDSEPEPDLSIVEGAETDYQSHPTTARLVVEVAVTSLADDRDLADLYAEAKVLEYWIINAKDQYVEVYRDPSAGHYLTTTNYALGDTLQSSSIPELSLAIADLFKDIMPSV